MQSVCGATLPRGSRLWQKENRTSTVQLGRRQLITQGSWELARPFGDVSPRSKAEGMRPLNMAVPGGSLPCEGVWPWMRWLLWVELHLPPKDVGFLNTCTCKCNLILKWDLCRYNQVRMRSYSIRVGPTPVTGILIYE